MSTSDRIECPNCRQSIKRPALPAGSKCLCPKCNQPFTVGGEAAGPVAAPPAPPAAMPPVNVASKPAQSQHQPPAPKSVPAAEKKPAEKKPAPTPPTEFRVHCYLCGSLMYAKQEQIGSTVKCHDCHSLTEVKPPRPQDWQTKSDGPKLDDAEDFALSPTFERPKFEAIEKAPPPEEQQDLFSTRPLPPMPASGQNPPVSVPRLPSPAQFAPPGLTSNPPPPPAPPVRKHVDSYGDELWNEPVDSGRPAFERSPFLVGIVEFLFYPGTLPRWLALTALACIPIAAIEVTSGAVGLFFVALLALPWLAIFGAHAMTIVIDTGRGRDAIEEWPLGGFLPNVASQGNPLFLPVAAFAAALPGLMYFLVSRDIDSAWGYIMVLVSTLLLLPLAWLPMLLEKSLQGPLQSPTFWQSFRFSGNGWIVFYFETLVLCLVGAGGVSLFTTGSMIVAPLAAVVVVTPLFLYFRLLGRLLWFIDPAMAPPPPPAKPGPAPLPETMDPTQLKRWQ